MSTRASFSLWLMLLFAVMAPGNAAAETPKALALRPKELLHHYLTFSDDSKTLIAVSQTWQEDTKNYKYALIFYDSTTGKETRRLALPGTFSPENIQIAPDGRFLALACGGKPLALWDLREGKLCRELPSSDHAFFGAVFSPDGKWLIARVNRPDNEFRRHDNVVLVVWEAASGKILKKIEANGAGEIRAFALAADGEHVFVEHHRLVGKDPRSGQPMVPWNVQTHVWSLTTGRDLGTVGDLTEYRGSGDEYYSEGYNLFLAGCAGRGSRLHRITGSDYFWTPWQGRVQFTQRGSPLVCPDYHPTIPVLQRNGGGFVLLDPASDQQLHDHKYFDIVHAHGVALSPDGTRVAAIEWEINKEPRLLLWDVTDLAERVRPRYPELTEERKAALWETLLRDDTKLGHAAMRELAASAARSLPLFRAKVQPFVEVKVDEKQVRRWIADLDDDDFKVRETATQNLERAGAVAKPLLEKTLAQKPSAEARRRLEELLEKTNQPISPAELRSLRTVEILEQIGNDEAQRLLRSLAGGAEASSLTRAAKQSLERLAKKEK